MSDKSLVVAGSLLLGVSFAFFASSQTAVIYAGTLLLAIGNGVMWPSLLAVLSKSTARGVQGAVQGLSGSVTASASIAGLVLGGGLYQVFGARVFLLSAAVTLLVSMLALRIPQLTAARSGSPA